MKKKNFIAFLEKILENIIFKNRCISFLFPYMSEEWSQKIYKFFSWCNISFLTKRYNKKYDTAIKV